MGALWSIVQAHLDRYGVREAELARRIGTSPQTLNSWKLRGVREIPSEKLLRNLARVTGDPYPIVFLAASVDAERITREEADEMSRSIRWSGTA